MRRIHRSQLQGFALALTLLTGPCENCDEETTSPPPDTSTEQVSIVSGNNQTVAPGGTITLAARAEYHDGTVIPGVSISWTAESGSVSPRTSVTNASGVATTVWTLPTGPGTYRVFALYHTEVIFRGSVAGCSNAFVITDDFSSDVAGRWTTTGPGTAPAPGFQQSYSATYVAASGNPGGYWEFHDVNTPPAALTVYHRLDRDYDPSLPGNQIDHINYSEDQIVLAPLGGPDERWSLFLEQGGTRYVPTNGLGRFANGVWATGLQTNLVPGQFVGANLGPTGGIIRFGFFRETSGGFDTYSSNHGIDNFRVEICRR